MEKTASIWHFFIPRLFWKNVFLTPLYWLFLCFFQPVRFSEQFEYRTIAGRFTLIVRLAIPLFLLIFLVALPVQGLLLCTDSCTPLSIFTWNTLSTIFLATLPGVICGLIPGVLDSVGLGIILSITLGITGIVMGDTGSGTARGIAVAVVSGLVTGTAKGSKWGMWLGILAGILGGLSWLITASISVSSMTENVTRFAVVACVFFVCYMIGYYRGLLYLVSGLSGLHTYIASKKNPTTVFLNLHNSSLYWDECVFLPLPLLRQTLLIAVEQNVEQALHEITFILKQRPQQIYAAQMTATEIALHDLQGHETIRDIARVSQRLNWHLSQEVKYFWENVFLTPLHWLFLCFFQPVRFSEQSEQSTIARRFTLLVRLAIPLFLLIFLVALPVQGLLPCTASCTPPPIFIWNPLSAIFLVTLLGVTGGLLIGVLDNVGLGIILSITLGITGIVLGDAGRGEARGIAVAVVAGLATGTARGLKWERWCGILAGILGGAFWIIASISVLTFRLN